MLSYSQFAFVAALITTVLACIAYVWAMSAGHRSTSRAPQKKVLVTAYGDDLLDDLDALPEVTEPRAGSVPRRRDVGGHPRPVRHPPDLARARVPHRVPRPADDGHRPRPFVTQYEFATSLAWGMLAAYCYFEWRYHARTLALFVLPMTVFALAYAGTQNSQVDPLVPALQNSLLLTIHIIVAIFAYGAFAISFAAAALTLWTPRRWKHLVPKDDVLDRLGYRAVVIGFPLDTMVLILGAVWAEIAWGSYWSWDPKETASLVTWLIYGGYLHARVARGWTGRRAAWLLVIGFASVVLTFAGNAFFGGLHSYA